MVVGLLTGALVGAVIGRVVTVASTHAEDYFKGRKGMGEELQRLRMLLPQIQSVVDAAERGEQEMSDPLQKWLSQLKDVLYEADDVLDELDYLGLKQQVNRKEQHKVRELMSQYKSKAKKFAKYIFKYDPTLDKLRGVVKKLVEVAAGVGNFVALVSNKQQEFKQQENQAILKRRTGPLLTENKVFGREEERDELLRWLTMMPADQKDESNIDVSLFSVVGHGGMGKTTLTQLVYNDDTVQQSFDLKIWVCVSTPFDVEGLTRSILEQATKQRPNVDGFSALQGALKEKLETSKKFLLVLDDVWNDDDRSNWEKLLAPLKYGRNGSKILLTTRMDKVADMAAKAMGASTMEPLKLSGLHGEDFSSLFNRYAFDGVDRGNYQNLQCIGMQIAERLGGSPLAAKIVGGLLNSKLNERYWRTILDSKNISDQVQHGEDNIMSILKLSYYHLPRRLRPCFAYCGMFRKDHEFRKKDLTLMWMAVGFIQHSDQNQGEMLEDVGGDYFDELLRRSLFDHKNDECYVMHDLLHDLAQSISHGECYNFVDDDKNVEGIIPDTIRHLYIESDNLDVLTKVDKWRNLRSLVLKIKDAGSEHSSGLERVFTSLESIRMLNIDFGERKVVEVTMPDAFSHLIHLRTLKIGGVVQNLPISLCKLYHVQVIQFDYREWTFKLPESINKLVNLRHMSANHWVAGVGKLKFLQDLSFSVKKERGYKIGELGGLIWLRSLDVKGLENVENQEEASAAKLCNKKYLQTLHLEWSGSSDPGMDMDELVLDRLRPHSNLKGLTIKGYRGIRYANWMGFERINNLQRISLSDFSRLEELWGSGGDAGQWHPHIDDLVIENCPKLEVLPSLSLSVRRICLDKLGLVSLPALWVDRNSTCSTSESLSSSSSLEALRIRNCGKITSLDNGLLLQQQQHHLTALVFLEIWNCPELVDFPSGGLQHLRALKRLEIRKCPKLQVAPETITPYGIFLPMSLQELRIVGCDELVKSLTALLKGLVSLDYLHIRDCGELMSLEGLMGFQSIGRLEITNTVWPDLTLAVRDLCIDDPLLLVSGALRSLSSVRWLTVGNMVGMEDLNILEQWLWQNHTTLYSIRMYGASSLKSLSHNLKNLSSLEWLYIYGASEGLMERCRKEGGADWSNISHGPIHRYSVMILRERRRKDEGAD